MNLAALGGDETKYLPGKRVKEEVLPTLRGDFIPASARKTEVKKWGFGTNPKINPYYCSQLWVSDAGLTQKQCEWEKEKDFETKDINRQIAQMLAELKYLEKHSPKMAVELAKNDNYLRKLNELRSQAEVFWQFSSIDNISLLGGEEWLRSMKRELPDLMFRLQILGQLPGKASDGFYCQFSEELNTYVSADCTDYILDKFSKKEKGRYLDAQRYPTDVEYLTLDMKELELAGENCSCDQDLNYAEPLRIAIDAGHEMNCMVVGQAVNYHGKPSVLVMKEFFVKGSTRLRGLVRMFTDYYKPFLRRNGEVIYYYNQTSKQGGATAYAVEDSEAMRFDNVVTQELESYGWKVTRGEFSVWRHERKWQLFCDIFSFQTSPSVYINSENGRCPYLLCAITSAGILNGFRKDKSREKYKSEDGVAGDPRTRTDITDAFDDLITGIKEGAEGNKKVGGGLRHKSKNLILPRYPSLLTPNSYLLIPNLISTLSPCPCPLHRVPVLPRRMAEVVDIFTKWQLISMQLCLSYRPEEPRASIVAMVRCEAREVPHIFPIEVTDAVFLQEWRVKKAKERLEFLDVVAETFTHVLTNLPHPCTLRMLPKGADVTADEYVAVHEHKRFVDILHEPLHRTAVLGRTVVIAR